MTAELPNPSQEPTRAASEIRYHRGATADVVVTTSSGLSCTVRPTRERAYPGLAGPAPQTEVLYRGIAPLFQGRRIVDVGSGVGLGAAVLGTTAGHVTAVDSSEVAVALCQEFAPRADAVELDARNLHTLGSFDGTVCIDVLGHIAGPIMLLRSIRKALRSEGVAVFAEPTAAVSQSLQAPVRRAFSKSFIKGLLATSGLRLQRFVSESYPFLVWTAVLQPDNAWQWLEHGIATSTSEPEEALAAFQRAHEGTDEAVVLEATLAEADLLLQLRRGDAACAAYIRAKELAPDDARPLAGLAAIMFEKGDRETSLQLTQMAMAKDPVDLVGRLTFASIMDEISPTRWASSWRTVNSLAPDNAEWALNFAQSALGGRFARDAILALDRLEQYPERVPPAVLAVKAQLLEAMGRKAEAALAARAATAA